LASDLETQGSYEFFRILHKHGIASRGFVNELTFPSTPTFFNGFEFELYSFRNNAFEAQPETAAQSGCILAANRPEFFAQEFE
jgi:hypothetical protein